MGELTILFWEEKYLNAQSGSDFVVLARAGKVLAKNSRTYNIPMSLGLGAKAGYTILGRKVFVCLELN